MVELYKIASSIATLQAQINTLKNALQQISIELNNDTSIPQNYANIINATNSNCKTYCAFLDRSISSLINTINEAWTMYRKQNPVIMPKFFIINDDGQVQETDAKTYAKLPKPIDNYTVPTINYENYEDIPGATIRKP